LTSLPYEDLAESRANLWRQQKRMECFPEYDVVIYRDEDRNSLCTFALDDQAITPYRPAREPYLCCYLGSALLSDILNRREHWNNAELGGWIEFERKGPYNPDVHTLLSFFHLPRPA
jgi:UDP-MurNAc hydroxylase